jgi:hypothetical protein
MGRKRLLAQPGVFARAAGRSGVFAVERRYLHASLLLRTTGMGIQVFKQLAKQRAYALGELRRLKRRSAPEAEIREASKLVDALGMVLEHQGLRIDFEDDAPLERRPKRRYFPNGAYRGDVLQVLREQARPMRVSEILDCLCAMHQVCLTRQERSHAAIKLAQGNDVLIGLGLVVRAWKAGDHRSAPCTYALHQAN